MTGKLKFSEYFWDEDFCGTVGFETLLKRLRDGRRMCKEWDHFIKERAKIEEDYATKLQRLVKTASSHAEMGSMQKSWEAVRIQTECIANEHTLAGKEMTKASERIQELMASQKSKRIADEQQINKSAKQKKDLYNKVMESKKSFHNKSLEADGAENNINDTKRKVKDTNMQIPAKDMDKMYTKCQKLKQDACKADSSYKDLLNQLEKVRKLWEADMVHMCNEFESLENERILFLRNEMWVHTNIISQTAVDDDEHCEAIRKSLEECDVDVDLTEFIEKKKIGRVKPRTVEYEGWGTTGPISKKPSIDSTMTYRPQQPLPGLQFNAMKPGAL